MLGKIVMSPLQSVPRNIIKMKIILLSLSSQECSKELLRNNMLGSKACFHLIAARNVPLLFNYFVCWSGGDTSLYNANIQN